MPGLDATRPESRTAAPAENGSQMHGADIATSHPEESRKPSGEQRAGKYARRGMPGLDRRCLVVDDEPEVLRSVHDLLRIDYQVITLRAVSEALARLA